MQITLTLNDKKLTADVAPDTLLIDFVRSHGCLSVKRGCETSNCGLCTVFLDDKPVLSCSGLMPFTCFMTGMIFLQRLPIKSAWGNPRRCSPI